MDACSYSPAVAIQIKFDSQREKARARGGRKVVIGNGYKQQERETGVCLT